jgi:outer membrane scaffolding protein for murein synthesis (MipA/OmpV family)
VRAALPCHHELPRHDSHAASETSTAVRDDDLKIGIGLTGNGGRRDYRTNGLFETGDDRLKGLGNINSALGIRGFATYRLGFIVLDGAVTKLTNHFDNNGVFANAGVSAPQKLSDRLILTPHVITTWANRNYTGTFVGVTAAQAADSAFPEFNAGTGFMNVAAGVAVAYGLPLLMGVQGTTHLSRGCCRAQWPLHIALPAALMNHGDR